MPHVDNGLGDGVLEEVQRLAAEENIPPQVSNRLVLAAVLKLSRDVKKLGAATNTHFADDRSHTPKGLLLRKEVLAWLLLFVVGVEALTPPEISVWEIVRKILGL